jgi:probable rRNA maturation factor
LSFHYFEDFSALKTSDTAGEIILNEWKIKTQAIEYELWEEREFYKLLIHSMLHILWYDHEEEEDYELMNSLENIIWKEIFEKKSIS